MVDPWEAGQSEYQRTAVVLEHFNDMLNGEGGGVVMSDGRKRKYKIMLLAGGDLIESFGEPGVWSEPDVSGTFMLDCSHKEIGSWAAAHHLGPLWMLDRREGRLRCMGFPALA